MAFRSRARDSTIAASRLRPGLGLVLLVATLGVLTSPALAAPPPPPATSRATSHRAATRAIEMVTVLRVRAGEHQLVPIREIASGAALAHARWSAQGLPPGLRLVADGRLGWAITGTPNQAGQWEALLRARYPLRSAWATTLSKVTVKVAVPSAYYAPTVDWVPRDMQIGEYGNEGLGDCTVAAMATDVQILRGAAVPLPVSPWIAEYDSLAEAAGEAPGPNVGVQPLSLFEDMTQPGNGTGVQISGTAVVATDVRTLTATLRSGPVYVVFSLPAASGSLNRRTDPVTGIVTGVWSNEVDAPYSTAVPAIHAALLVGYDTTQHYFFIATWGHVFAMPYAYFESVIADAWVIEP